MVYETPHYPGRMDTTTLPTDKTNEIRVLAVRQPWASLIVEGLKTIEVRSKPTNIRGRVAIYASVNLPSQNEFIKIRQELAHQFLGNQKYDPTEELHIGKIIGTVEIVGCVKLRNEFEYTSYADEHLAPLVYYQKDNTYFWDLKHPVKFSEPIPYKPLKGAVVWSKTTLPEGY